MLELHEFLNELLNAATYGGIATENPTEEKLHQFHMSVMKLKRQCGCHIDDYDEFKKKMPQYYQLEEGGIPMTYAETGRLALKEIAPCCLAAIFKELIEPE